MTDELIKQPVHWIDTNSALEDCCQAWETLALLALDTEFIRTTTYYPIAGLLQVNDGLATYLIDPLGIDDWYPLIEILEDEQRIIVMHSCSEDLEVLQIEVGTTPRRILDTQIAAAFLGEPSSLGYASLVKSQLDIELPKAETRSDWLQRPLSKPQMKYAALDVEYLYKLAELFVAELEQQKKLDWVMEEGRRAYRNFKQLQDIGNSHKRIKSAWKLSQRKLAVLIALARWRENYAQQNDLPRNRIIKEKALLEISLQCPQHISGLRKIEGIPERIIRKQGADIIDLIRAQLALPEEELPSALPSPLAKQERESVQLLKSKLLDTAETLGVAADIMLRKKDIEQLIRFKLEERWSEIEEYFSGWRRDAIAEPVVRALKEL